MCDTSIVAIQDLNIELIGVFEASDGIFMKEAFLQPALLPVEVKIDNVEIDPSQKTLKVVTLPDPAKSELPFSCNLCPLRFQEKQAFLKHEQTHLKWHQCMICPRKFLTRNHLTCHERTHTGEKPFQCNVCSLRFARNSTLTVHKRRHNDKRLYNCQYCNKHFRHFNTLKVHVRTHTEKTFICDLCDMSFAEKRPLRVHINKHAGKPFTCEVCGKKLAFKALHDRHKLLHSTVKIFTCKTCQKTYRSRGQFTEHIKFKHKKYSCRVCAEEFEEKSVLNLHKLGHVTCGSCKKKFPTVKLRERHEAKKYGANGCLSKIILNE